MKKTIGQRMKERRKELKLSADELAIRLSKDRSTIYRYEKGDIENLPIDLLKPIADALEMSPAELMGWNDSEMNAIATAHSESMEDLSCFDEEIKEQKLIRENQKKIRQEIGDVVFSDDEINQIVDYVKFIISRRKE